VGRWELQSAAADVARLRDAAARLEKRLDALRRRVNGS
jgi:ubiquinone biosynthesis protein UbiJ